ncbi:hypothetical protein GCM10011583_49120 [Streptomyces camponoticapitis]|uniref:Uncharacterized protein n=1 Tax=Streptomyces camponoticapitis TaxID=1616125 RepID=A0ABQ2EJC9_9ACTN|nr:hypothetical protein GCM10011583_49120 [Streptomyces camponoticapitis]
MDIPASRPYVYTVTGTDLAAGCVRLRIRCADSSKATEEGEAAGKPAAGRVDCLVTVFPGKPRGFQEKATYTHNGVAPDAGEMVVFRPVTAWFDVSRAIFDSVRRIAGRVGFLEPGARLSRPSSSPASSRSPTTTSCGSRWESIDKYPRDFRSSKEFRAFFAEI